MAMHSAVKAESRRSSGGADASACAMPNQAGRCSQLCSGERGSAMYRGAREVVEDAGEALQRGSIMSVVETGSELSHQFAVG